MGRWFPLPPEVFRGGNQATTEDHLPIPVNRDPGEQGVIRGSQPAGQRQAVPGALFIRGGEESRSCRSYHFLAIRIQATVEYVRLAIAGHFTHDHDLLESLAGVPVFLASLSKNSQLLLVGLVNGLQEEGQQVVLV